MTLFVKTLTGLTITVNFSYGDTIYDIKKVIEQKEGIKAEQQMLIFAGKELEDTKKASDYNIHSESTMHLINIRPIVCRIQLKLCRSRKAQSIRPLPVSLESNNPPKTQIVDVDGFEFEPAFQLQRALLSSELVRKYAFDGVPGLLDIIESYCNDRAVCFGDAISVSYNLDDYPPIEKQQILNVNGVTQFRIMKGYGDMNYDGQPVRYGQDFVLQISKDHYLQRTDRITNVANYPYKSYYRIGSQYIADSDDSDMEYGQTWQFDIVDASVMGRIVRYGSAVEALGLTIGGNFPIKTEEDHQNPNCNFRCWITFRGKEGWIEHPEFQRTV